MKQNIITDLTEIRREYYKNFMPTTRQQRQNRKSLKRHKLPRLTQ